MSALLHLVVNNVSNLKSEGGSSFKQPRINLAQSLLERASSLLNELGSGYASVSLIIDECKEMISRKDCEPFANLKEEKSIEELP